MRVCAALDLADHLASLGLREADDVVVHSRLLSFGLIDGGVATIYQTLRHAIGPDGTIAVPTYTTHLKAHDVFDPAATPSHGVGALPEFVRTLPTAVRSACPMHSHAAVGPQAGMLHASNPSFSFGGGSDFAQFRAHGFKLLLLGCTFHEGATYIHHVEASVGVPYRQWLHLDRQMRAGDGAITSMRLSYYGKTEARVHNHLHAVEDRVAAERLGTFSAVPGGQRQSCLIPLEALDDCVRAMLQADPWCLVKCGDVRAG